MKRADVYLRKASYFINALSRTTKGVWIAAPPYIALSEACTDRDLGEAILMVLQCSGSEVQHPEQHSWPTIVAPILKNAGVKTWESFARNAQSISVDEEEGNLTIVPYENRGSAKGFVEEHTRNVNVKADSPDAVGKCVRGALSALQGAR
jgi:hypothetical protein